MVVIMDNDNCSSATKGQKMMLFCSLFPTSYNILFYIFIYLYNILKVCRLLLGDSRSHSQTAHNSRTSNTTSHHFLRAHYIHGSHHSRYLAKLALTW